MATGVIYKVDCGDKNSPEVTCPRKPDSKCVIYKGEDLPEIDISKGDDLETIIIKLTTILHDLQVQLEELEDRVDEEYQKIMDRITIITSTLTYLKDLLEDIKNNFCTMLEDCNINLGKVVIGEMTGCSTSSKEYRKWNPESTTAGYYVETYVDLDMGSPNFGKLVVEHQADKDGKCPAAPKWELQTYGCSASSSTYAPSSNPDENIYGFVQYKRLDEVSWQRASGYDSTCNPPTDSDLQGWGDCSTCASISISVEDNSQTGSSGSFSNWTASGVPSGFSVRGTCISGKGSYSESEYNSLGIGSVSVTLTGTYNITCAADDEWRVKVGGNTTALGKGSATGEVTLTLKPNYRRVSSKEGNTYYVCY